MKKKECKHLCSVCSATSCLMVAILVSFGGHFPFLCFDFLRVTSRLGMWFSSSICGHTLTAHWPACAWVWLAFFFYVLRPRFVFMSPTQRSERNVSRHSRVLKTFTAELLLMSPLTTTIYVESNPVGRI